MSSIFGTKATLLYDVNLLLQILILILLFIGRKFVKDKKHKNHGIMMTIAVTLHTISILLIMIPSFVTYFGLTISSFSLGIVITWIHAIVGILAEVLGIFIVVKWRFQPEPMKICGKRRKFMIPLFILWTFALILGIAFYIQYYL